MSPVPSKLKACATRPLTKPTPPFAVPLLLPTRSFAVPSPANQLIIPGGGAKHAPIGQPEAFTDVAGGVFGQASRLSTTPSPSASTSVLHLPIVPALKIPRTSVCDSARVKISTSSRRPAKRL